MKCPQLSKPEATAARNQKSLGDRMEKKKSLGETRLSRGASSPLARRNLQFNSNILYYLLFQNVFINFSHLYIIMTDSSVKLLRYTDNTTVNGLIQDGEESVYRREVEQLAFWCSQ